MQSKILECLVKDDQMIFTIQCRVDLKSFIQSRLMSAQSSSDKQVGDIIQDAIKQSSQQEIIQKAKQKVLEDHQLSTSQIVVQDQQINSNNNKQEQQQKVQPIQAQPVKKVVDESKYRNMLILKQKFLQLDYQIGQNFQEMKRKNRTQ